MNNEFQFKGFEPDEYVKAEADVIYENIQDSAAGFVKIAALLEFDGHQYHCSIDVYRKRGAISASTSDVDLFRALRRVEDVILQKIDSSHSRLTKHFRKPFELLKHY